MYNKHATEKGLSSFGICKTISGRLLSSSAEVLDLKCSDLYFDPIIRMESHKKATLVNRSSAVFLIPTQTFQTFSHAEIVLQIALYSPECQ